MSNTIDPVVTATETPPAADAAPAPAATPRILKIHGKEFDVSTPEGMIHAQAWGEANESLKGKLANEVGALRKFAAAHKPSKSESELLSEAKKRAAEGDVEGAIEQMFGYAKEIETKSKQTLAQERQDSETWDAYFESRPAVVKAFGKQTVRKVSENAIENLKELDDPFEALDNFWNAKTLAVAPAPSAPAAPASTSKVPPATLSGGSARPLIAVEPPKEVPGFDELLDGVSLSSKLSKFKAK